MTSLQKTTIAAFLDTADDFLSTGFRSDRADITFADDEAPTSQDAPPLEAVPAASATYAGIEDIAAACRNCRSCVLCETRRNVVPGEGVSAPLALIVGEAPGSNEDNTGHPFVGDAGKLLDKMLASIGLFRDKNCFIANVIKCRPPNNRDPSAEEQEACIHFLEAQITLLKPRAILCVGRIAAQALLKTNEPMSNMRGGRKWDYRAANGAIPLFATYHPSALLRNEGWKRPAWEDLKAFKAFLDG